MGKVSKTHYMFYNMFSRGFMNEKSSTFGEKFIN
jgi:hypothetical protein